MDQVNFQTVRLRDGVHRSPEDGVCVMELASMLAGEPFSDRPASVSRVVAAVLRGYNDGLDPIRRQSLKRLAASSVGTGAEKDLEDVRRRRVHERLLDRRMRLGFVVRLAVRWRLISLYSLGWLAADRVITTRDDGLHARTLGVLDELIAIGPGSASALDAEALLCVDEPERSRPLDRL